MASIIMPDQDIPEDVIGEALLVFVSSKPLIFPAFPRYIRLFTMELL